MCRDIAFVQPVNEMGEQRFSSVRVASESRNVQASAGEGEWRGETTLNLNVQLKWRQGAARLPAPTGTRRRPAPKRTLAIDTGQADSYLDRIYRMNRIKTDAVKSCQSC